LGFQLVGSFQLSQGRSEAMKAFGGKSFGASAVGRSKGSFVGT
jgi:hypothetical protein